jgi:proton glutamate symport protein
MSTTSQSTQATNSETPRKVALHTKILIALVAGALLGIALNQFWTLDTWKSLGVHDAKAYLAGTAVDSNAGASTLASIARFANQTADLVGKLFLRGLRFIAVPIILFSIIVAVAGLGDPRKLGRLGAKTLGIFAVTVIAALVIALVLVNMIQPGLGVSEATREAIVNQSNAANAKTLGGTAAAQALSFREQVLGMLTTNPFESLAKGDMLQVVIAAILVGLGLTLIPKAKAAPVIAICDGLSEAILELVRLLLRLAPIAVFCLITPVITSLGLEALSALAKYCVAILLGMAAILFIEYPIVLTLFTNRRNAAGVSQRVGIARFFKALAPAQLLAFSSSSSAATLPVTMECCNDRLKVPEDITSFVCPLGTTINMDGTALFQTISVIFLAQLYGVDLSFAQQLTVAGLSVLVAIGAPGLPSASVVMMVVPLQAVGVPIEGIALILAVDRILDMARTVVNVSGDAVAAAVVASSEGRMNQASAN